MSETVEANPQAGEATETTPAAVGDGEKFDAEYVRQLRKEAAGYRTHAKEADAKLAAYEAERMTETERLKAQADANAARAQAAHDELRKARAEAAIAREAVKLGIDPALLERLVDVQYDDDGRPQNVAAAVEATLKLYPQLKPATPTPGSTNPGRKPGLTIDDVRKMTPEQVNARWDEVQAAMSRGG